jgi:hypothetical protein
VGPTEYIADRRDAEGISRGAAGALWVWPDEIKGLRLPFLMPGESPPSVVSPSSSPSSPFVLRLAFHQANWRGHGGVHRTTQVVELLRKTGLTVPAPAPAPAPAVAGAAGPQRRAQSLKRLMGTHLPVVKSAMAQVAEVWRFRQGLLASPAARVLVWEATKQLFPLHEARRRGLKVVAIPQNMESLDRPDLPEGTQKAGALRFEVEALLLADAVFTLSREDTWFLRLFGVKAFCLPYFPPEELQAELLAIRADRVGQDSKRFLLVGSAVHEATRLGLQECLTWLLHARQSVPFQLDVAGFGTEKLSAFANHADFVVHGAVTQERLAEMQQRAAGAIVHHSPYSGSLTRVSEMVMAGLPVLANQDGARAAGYPGVHVYRDVDELTQLLRANLPVPPVPPRSVREEDFFVEALARFATE